MNKINLTGLRFGKLTVLHEAEADKQQAASKRVR